MEIKWTWESNSSKKEIVDFKRSKNNFKINTFYFLTKDKTPYLLKSFLVFKFVSARCSSYYICKACCHFKTIFFIGIRSMQG